MNKEECLYCAKKCMEIYKDSNCNVFNECTGVAVKILGDKQTLYIFFRGSDETKDWYYNLNPTSHTVEIRVNNLKKQTNTHSHLILKVHAGFHKQWRSVKTQVLEQSKYIINSFNVNRIVLSGHSSGSALCYLACLDIYETFDIPIECITFGSPKVGDNNFSIYLTGIITTSIRFVNEYDPVPLIPLRYTHPPGLFKLYNETTQVIQEEKFEENNNVVIPWYKRLQYNINTFFIFLKYLFTIDKTENHHIKVYYNNLLQQYPEKTRPIIIFETN